MADEGFEQVFARIRDFDWDPVKRAKTFKERGIDFDDVRHVLAGPFLAQRSDRKGEIRWMVFGFLADVEVTYVCTIRGSTCWVMSARRAKRNERKKHHDRLARDSSQVQE